MVGMGIVLKLLVLLFACLSPAFGFTGFLTCKSLFEGVCTDAEKKAGHVCIERQGNFPTFFEINNISSVGTFVQTLHRPRMYISLEPNCPVNIRVIVVCFPSVHTYRSKIREFHNECENLKGHLVDAPKVKGSKLPCQQRTHAMYPQLATFFCPTKMYTCMPVNARFLNSACKREHFN